MTEPDARAVIVGLGARTVGGLTALQATMSARAQLFLLRESHLIDRHGEPMGVARLPSIGDQVVGLPRFAALAAPALVQAVFPYRELLRARGTKEHELPLLVALPEAGRPGSDPLLTSHLFAVLEARSRIPIDRAKSSLVLGGRAAFATVVAQARELLQQGSPAVIAGGVDSYFHPDLLDHLDNEHRLHALDTENGLIPGEGAAFMVLVPEPTARLLDAFGTIVAASAADEPRPYGSEEPCLSVGLTRAMRAAAAAASAPLCWVLSDTSNERHRVDDFIAAFGRNHRTFAPNVVHGQPLLKTGDVGAAALALLTVMACIEFQVGSAVAPEVLLVSASDGPCRGAMVLRKGAAR